jgi:predicted RNA-binding Zn ribbon-like protein
MADGDPAPAPLPLRWVEELVNTRSVELGTDDIATPGDLASWLQERDLLPPAVRVPPAAHARALQLREGLRALIAANNDGDPPAPAGPEDGVDPHALAELARLANDLPLVLDVTARPARLASRATGTVDAALATLLAAIAGAIADGSWSRMKACRDPGCRWAYFDHSRNRSRAWCSMALCGNRAKARAFRRRGSSVGAGDQDG